MVDDTIKTAFGHLLADTPPAPAFAELGPGTRPKSSTSRFPAFAAAAAVVIALVALIVALQDRDPVVPPAANSTTTSVEPSTSTTGPVITSGVVPNVVGMSLEEAAVVLKTAGYQAAEPAPWDPSGPGSVVWGQEPTAGIEVEAGATVGLRTAVSSCEENGASSPDTVLIYFSCDRIDGNEFAYVPVRRPDLDDIPLTEAVIHSLVAGPNPGESAAGFSSWFSEATQDAVNLVTFDTGHLVVDFNDSIRVNNMSTSGGAVGFNTELRTNVFAIEEVDSVEFRLNGSCESWSTVFESDGCWVVTREAFENGTAPASPDRPS